MIYQSTFPSAYMPIFLLFYLFKCHMSVSPHIHLSTWLPVFLSTHSPICFFSIHKFLCIPVQMFTCVLVYLFKSIPACYNLHVFLSLGIEYFSKNFNQMLSSPKNWYFFTFCSLYLKRLPIFETTSLCRYESNAKSFYIFVSTHTHTHIYIYFF